MDKKILVVDDDNVIRLSLKEYFNLKGWSASTADNGEDCLHQISQSKDLDPFSIALIDVRLPDMHGLDLLDKIKKISPHIIPIIITGYGNVPQAVEAMQRGAFDYLLKPFTLEELQLRIDKAVETLQLKSQVECLSERLQQQLKQQYVQGPNARMKQIYAELEIIAASPSSTVLIHGETGTGKEVIAQIIHSLSSRRHRPFIEVNATALTAELLESELFGHEQGAFTGALQTKKGLFELANGGTLFLDEIGDMPLPLQAKLLRSLQEKKIRRVGGTTHIPIDIRLLTASNKALEEAVKKGEFREDLYYRLNVINVNLPPLRERKEDIEAFVHHFVQVFNREFGKNVQKISHDALEVLIACPWYGNVRELRNLIERSMLLECKGTILELKHLRFLESPIKITENQNKKENQLISDANKSAVLNPENSIIPLEVIERQHIESALRVLNGNKNQAAQMLGIDRSTLYNKLKKYHLEYLSDLQK
ncbi:MAG: sigma-54-dependent transcriptional response regulator [Chlamydiales bacterium]|jgi:two-component system response regulator AtoC|nr:sigma-54-dependent transcriptional response regulator [Chlamydiales bacterium]